MNYFDREEWPGFLASIRANPADDLPRLVAADWLEENGEPERAEFVRVSVECAKTPELVWRNKLLHKVQWETVRRDGEPWGERFELASPADTIGVYHYRETNPEYAKLYGRTAALADGIFGRLLGPVALAGGTWTVERGFVSRVRAPLAILIGGECEAIGRYHHDRCNGGRIVTPNPAFTMDCYNCHGTGRTPGILRELLRREPLGPEGIEVSDREPWRVVGGHSWWLEHSSESDNPGMAASGLPRELFDRLDGFAARSVGDCRRYPTESAARLALSRAVYAMCSTKSEVMT